MTVSERKTRPAGDTSDRRLPQDEDAAPWRPTRASAELETVQSLRPPPEPAWPRVFPGL